MMMTMTTTMMKKMTRPSVIHFLAALSLVLSFHPCACTELYENRIHAEFYSDCPEEDLSGVFQECGDPAGRCICQDHTAYCDVSSPALPVLPDDVYVLNLCNNYFGDLYSLDFATLQLTSQFFSQMKNVTELRIMHYDIMPEAFVLLANVTKVYIICFGHLSKQKPLINILVIPNLRSFSSEYCELTLLSLHHGLQSPLQSFSAKGRSTDNGTLDLTVFKMFKDLKRISIVGCGIEQVQPAVLPALEELILDNNELTFFPQTCDVHNNSLFPSLKRMSLSRNRISHIGGISITLCSHDQAQPAALPALEELILDYNDLTSFPQTCDMHNNSFFPSLKRISFSQNHIIHIGGTGSATCLPQVTEIDVSDNPITRIQRSVFDAQSSPRLETVTLCNSILFDRDPPTIHTEDFIFANPSIRTLNLTNVGWKFDDCTPENCVAQNTFAGLSSLTHLYLDGNDFGDPDSFFALFGSLGNLTHLSVRNSKLDASIISDGRFCGFPLEYLDLSEATLSNCYMTVLDEPPCQNSHIKIFKADKVGPFIHFSGLCKSRYKNFLLRVASAGSAIEHVSFRDNSLDFGHISSDSLTEFSGVLPESLDNKPSLRVLLLDRNDFSNVDAELFVSLFGKLTNLEKLSLSNCGIKHVSAEMFHSFPRLQYLDLSINKFNTLSSQTFSASPSLNVLYLHGNVLSVVPEGLFSSDQRRGMTKFTLYQNPLVCSCDNRWLQNWLLSDPDLFDYSSDPYPFGYYSQRDLFDYSSQSYRCYDDPTKSLASYTMPDQACMLGQEAAIVIIITSTVTITALTAFSLLFRYRWSFRLLLYYAMSGRPNYEGRRRNYVYDVFVSYDQENFKWIRQQLMPELEDRMGLRVCIHQRDFIPGHYIVTNITQAVEHSKKVLMVFSRHFVLSRWCQFEVDFCLSHAIENRDSLLIVCLDDVASDETLLTGAMKAALSTMTYIQWINRPDAVHFFWERVGQSLGDVRPRDREAGRRRLRDVLDPDARVRIEIQVMDF